jgi:hypothetical protein
MNRASQGGRRLVVVLVGQKKLSLSRCGMTDDATMIDSLATTTGTAV